MKNKFVKNMLAASVLAALQAHVGASTQARCQKT